MCLDDCNEFSPLPASLDSGGVIPCAQAVVSGGVGNPIHYDEFAMTVIKLFEDLCIVAAGVCIVTAGLTWMLT